MTVKAKLYDDDVWEAFVSYVLKTYKPRHPGAYLRSCIEKRTDVWGVLKAQGLLPTTPPGRAFELIEKVAKAKDAAPQLSSGNRTGASQERPGLRQVEG